ncbi:MAG: methyltransferase domain-containing protein [Bacteroidetes bacterium]|nr:methyltransferase domain-containing protein [Bacteroidota bacterium]
MKNLLLPLSLFFTSLCFGQASLSSGDEHEKERARWNKSLVHDTAYRFNRNPNALLVQTEKGLKKGTALDIGMGQGRNSVFLAKQGWKVTGIDIADEAVHYALEQAKGNHVTIDARITPMEDLILEPTDGISSCTYMRVAWTATITSLERLQRGSSLMGSWSSNFFTSRPEQKWDDLTSGARKPTPKASLKPVTGLMSYLTKRRNR